MLFKALAFPFSVASAAAFATVSLSSYLVIFEVFLTFYGEFSFVSGGQRSLTGVDLTSTS